ncbi:early protein E5, partial [Papio hamadryas papillomavirus 1]
ACKTATILLFVVVFLLLFLLGLVACVRVSALLLCLHIYAHVLLLMLLFWVTITSPAAAFALCVGCFLCPLFFIHLHALSVVYSRME